MASLRTRHGAARFPGREGIREAARLRVTALWAVLPESDRSAGFGDRLRHWRAVRRTSQLDLASAAETTPRYVSFVETGRARPSREMVLRLARAMDVPLRERIGLLQTDLCSRCGLCETRCSQKLPVSWMFRAAYVARYPSESYETWDEVEYFRLHPGEQATCVSCPDVTCGCPYGIDLPHALPVLHVQMIDLRDRVRPR